MLTRSSDLAWRQLQLKWLITESTITLTLLAASFCPNQLSKSVFNFSIHTICVHQMDAEENFLYSMLIINLFYLSYLYFGFCIIFEKIIIKGLVLQTLNLFSYSTIGMWLGILFFVPTKKFYCPKLVTPNVWRRGFHSVWGKIFIEKGSGLRCVCQCHLNLYTHTHIYTMPFKKFHLIVPLDI